jgi:hypothetical protein
MYESSEPNKLLSKIKNLYLYILVSKKISNSKMCLRKHFDRYKSQIIKLNNKLRYNSNLSNILLCGVLSKIKQNLKGNIFHMFLQMYNNNILNKNNSQKNKLFYLLKRKEAKEKDLLKLSFNNFRNKGTIYQIEQEKIKYIEMLHMKKINNIKQIINKLEKKIKTYYIYRLSSSFEKWKLISKILAMKAVTDEKKRKKRQKQRTKKKSDKNKSANKYYLNSDIITSNCLKTSYSNSNFNISKDLNKEKEMSNYFEHSSTTEFSGGEIDNNKFSKITRATEKLHELFGKAIMKIKIPDNTNKVQEAKKSNEKEIKDDNDNDDNDDSGESSFGL